MSDERSKKAASTGKKSKFPKGEAMEIGSPQLSKMGSDMAHRNSWTCTKRRSQY